MTICLYKAETPVLWPPHVKSWLIGKDSDAGGDWGQEEKGTTEDEMAGWHHQLDWREFEWTPGVGDGQGGLACCDSWGRKKSDMTQRLNWTELICLYQVNVLILLNIFLKSLLERMGETTTCFIRFSGEAERKWGTISRFNSPGH